MKLLRRLQILGSLFRLARDPRQLDAVLRLTDRVAAGEDVERRIPSELRTLARSLPPRRPLPGLSVLRALPVGSVGREYARFLDTNGLTPDAIVPVEGEGEIAALRGHIRDAHDLWHVATGWGADLLGELGLQAFYLAQLRVPAPGLILLGGLAHTMWKHPRHLWEVLDAVAEGWRQGQEADKLAAVDWSQWIAKPVAELRAGLRLAPARSRPEPVIPLIDVPAARGSGRVAAALLLTATSMTAPGCLLLLAEPNCAGESIDTSGAVTIGEAPHDPVATSMDIDTADAGACVTEVFIDFDFGRDCTMWVRADGGGQTLSVYELAMFNADACGLPGGFAVSDPSGSSVEVDGTLGDTPDPEMTCWNGAFVVRLDALIESGDESVPMIGELRVEGVENAYVNEQRCE
jgi:ubiquinone biosynthesis protein Coq4